MAASTPRGESCHSANKTTFDIPYRLFGVTTLDVMRGSTFVAEAIGKASLSKDIIVPVIGGHSGETVSSDWVGELVLTAIPPA